MFSLRDQIFIGLVSNGIYKGAAQNGIILLFFVATQGQGLHEGWGHDLNPRSSIPSQIQWQPLFYI